jgi:hypothetical protein
MPRVKLMSAMAYDLTSYEESAVADPVIRVLGELPAGSQPFGINRVYKGPQGRYEEVLAVADSDGRILWESQPRLIELRGMMFEDLFRREVRDRLEITSAGEHAVLFYLDGELTGRIPVFIDAPGSAKTAGVVLDAAEAALKKGSICWITIDQPRGGVATRPAWYVQQGSKLFVIKGGSEQELPNLENVPAVTISVKSKEQKAALGELKADVRVVESGSDEFERIAGLGLGNRLNLPDGEDALERWKAECTVVELSLRD